MCEKIYICNLATYSCQNGKCVGSIIDDSVVICNDIIEETKTVPAKLVTTNGSSASFYVLLSFLLITIASSIAVSICCYLTKY